MNTESDRLCPAWVPLRGFQLRKAGVQFDAVRVDGDGGRALADGLARLTAGDPGPVVEEANGRRSVYFLVAAGSTAYRPWPVEVTRLAAGPGHIAYIPVPALNGCTWPLSWRHRPRGADLVHTQLLRSALFAL
ncbi:hypothetical protein DSC45_32000 [Streptomyces sp. YIM 130001]|uniref:hypothetical protein n=1 Tax=Streptomyces sp. YIM 130001 TaxID=2259644 RepID=UPI000E6476B2|nr:hypothetical protein [Streptomyces sp. YIM 130001]RII09148.1 hypothetical protein DSC45_32000 [Streptomyces sp. YIM 130001]